MEYSFESHVLLIAGNRRRKDPDRPDLSILQRGKSLIEMVVKHPPPVDRIPSQSYPLSAVSWNKSCRRASSRQQSGGVYRSSQILAIKL